MIKNEISIYKEPERLLQNLIRFNTTNPPGNEKECIEYISQLFDRAGIENTIITKSPKRPNLIARLKGSGTNPPFLMFGHADVVPSGSNDWKHHPFQGVMEEGCVWGRGALDMKGALAMMISSLIRVKVEGIVPSCDIIFVVVSDEEDEGEFGAKYLVEHHGGLFKNVKYAISELGGFTMYMGRKKLYPIMISEKQKCPIRLTIRGEGGHGSLPVNGGTVSRLSKILNNLNNKRLPLRINEACRVMINEFASNMSFPTNIIIKGLLNPVFSNILLDIMGEKGKAFDAILHNTLNPTIIRGGNKINVIPDKITVECDGRILPESSPEEFISDIRKVIGNSADIEVLRYIPGPAEVDMGFFDKLKKVLKEIDSEAIPLPFVVSCVTDARYFAQLGIQTYGFTPMLLPKDFEFSKLIHGVNERIPLEALNFGTNSIFKLLKSL